MAYDKSFITDLGGNATLTDSNGVKTKLARYGVWSYDPMKGKYQVVETGDDLAALVAKYNITTDYPPHIGRATRGVII